MSKIWVVLQKKDDGLHRMSREAIALAQKLGAATGGTVEAIVLGHGNAAATQQAAGYALGQVWSADHEKLSNYTPGGFVGVLKQAIATAQPDWVVFPHSYQTVDFFARLAQEAGTGLLPEVIGFRSADDGLVWKRPVLGGKLQAEVKVGGEGPVLVSVQSGAYGAEEAEAGTAPVAALEVDYDAVTVDREILGVEEVAGDQIDLSAAEVVLAVGRGIGGPENMGSIEELAGLLGAEIGASRPVIDNGWLPRDRQIGSSGQTVAPKLYLTLGISGAIQHLVGMKGSQVVVAVNKDPGAPIFSVADYGIVGDLHELLPPLIAALKEAQGGA